MDHDTALGQSVEYFNGDKLAAGIFIDKYALTHPSGDILEGTPEAMHRRLARELARTEAKYLNPMSEDMIFEHLDRFKYIVAQGSPMSGIGNPYSIQTLGNCYVLPSVIDSYGGILKTDQELVQLAKRRAGIGTDISNIRPRGLPTSNAAKTTDGIAVFMERFSNSCREVAQSGRRGALILSLSVHHPEIETFINIKKDRKKVTGANISIRFSDEFMLAVKENKEYQQRWPVDSKTPSVTKMVSARKIWEQFIEGAWDSAEPGCFFWDTILRRSPADSYAERYPSFKTISSNPCGEIVMGEDSCRLLLLNTLSYVKNPFTKNAVYDWDLWKQHVKVAQRLMDDVVDLELECIDRILKKIESDPEPEDVKYTEYSMWKRFKKTCEQGRRTGLGITALGDALAALGMTYGSEDSIDITENIYRHLAVEAYRCSVEMAKERGAFPIYDHDLEKDNVFIKQIMDEDDSLKENWKKYGRRNIALTTTAPAGSVSTLTQTSSGIEPVFELIYTRRRKIMSQDKEIRVDFTDDLGDKWQEFKVYHPQFKNWMDISGKTEVEDSPWWKSRSSDVSWEAGVRLQAAAQKWICHSISKTCNLPKEATKELVSDIYMTAYDSGCKGFTIYRDGSRAGVLITEPKEETSKQEKSSIVPPPGASFLDRHAPRRPTELACDISTTTVKGEKWTFFIGLHEDRPYEIMGGLSKYISIPKRIKEGKIVKHNGELNPIPRYDLHYDFQKSLEDETIIKDIAAVFDNATNAAFTRTISLALRHGTPVQFVVEQLLKGSEKEDDLFSFSRAVSRVLKSYIKDGTKTSAVKVCPACGSPDLAYQEGCLSCKNCGHSRCG